MKLAARPKRVLVVDDNEDAAALVADIVSLAGHSATFATSGIEGLRIALAERPDAIFIDIEMPGMDGFKLAAKLRAEAPSTWLIALTVWSDPETARRAVECGFDEHLVKPANVEDILRAVDSSPRA